MWDCSKFLDDGSLSQNDDNSGDSLSHNSYSLEDESTPSFLHDTTTERDEEEVRDEADATFSNIGQQLTSTLEEVDQHFETLFQAIEDRFILSSSSEAEDDDLVVDMSSDEQQPAVAGADSSAEVDQICRTN